jgi:hypothetical protein
LTGDRFTSQGCDGIDQRAVQSFTFRSPLHFRFDVSRWGRQEKAPVVPRARRLQLNRLTLPGQCLRPWAEYNEAEHNNDYTINPDIRLKRCRKAGDRLDGIFLDFLFQIRIPRNAFSKLADCSYPLWAIGTSCNVRSSALWRAISSSFLSRRLLPSCI